MTEISRKDVKETHLEGAQSWIWDSFRRAMHVCPKQFLYLDAKYTVLHQNYIITQNMLIHISFFLQLKIKFS